MPETLTLTNPIPAVAAFDIAELNLSWKNSSIRIELSGPNGEPRVETIEGDIAHNLMVMLNTIRLDTKSLKRRILEWLAANRPGYAGNVSGVPDA